MGHNLAVLYLIRIPMCKALKRLSVDRHLLRSEVLKNCETLPIV